MRLAFSLVVLATGVAIAAPVDLVVCAPGSPGSTEEARPAMATFAAAVSAKSGATVTAVYEPSDEAGAARLRTAGLALVSLPFFLEHEKTLGLHARLDVVQAGRPALERWVLVAPKGRVHRADTLAGFTIVSNVAFAPGFVRGAVRELGDLPANVKLVQSTAVLSSLHRAAAGEPVAVLLDGAQAESLRSLPFAAQLEVIARSPPMPAAVVATVEGRLTDDAWRRIETAMLGLAKDPALAGIHVDRFVPVDTSALAAARELYAK